MNNLYNFLYKYKRISKTFGVLIFTILINVYSNIYSQNAIVGSGFSSGWGGACGSNANFSYLGSGAGSSYIRTTVANGTGNQYFRIGVDWGGTVGQYNTLGGAPDVAASINTEYTINSTCTTNGALYLNVSSTSHNYVFKTKDAGSAPSFKLIIFRVEGTVQTISSNSTPSGTKYPGETYTVTATTSGTTTGQGFYLRYTTDNWSSSTILAMSGSGTSYTATIPASAHTAGTTIKYYTFSSGNGLTISHANADWYTINLSSTSTYTVNSTCITTQTGNWSSSSTWAGGVVPPSGQPVTINHDVTLNQNATVSSLTINSGKTLTGTDGSARTLTIATSGTFTNNGIFTATSNSTVSFTGAGTVSGSSAITFNNITINSGTITLSTVPIINGTLQINGGSFNAAPKYGSNSTLLYNTGANPQARGAEWNATGTGTIGVTEGYPNNVTISNNNILNYPSGSPNTARAMEGSLTVNSGSALYMDYGSPSTNAALTVKGNITINGNLSFGDASGGDIYIGGNYTEAASGININYNGRAVIFNGAGTQTLTKTGGGTISYAGTGVAAYFLIDKTAGSVQLSNSPATNITLTQTTGDVFQINNTGGLDLNGQTFTMSGTNGNILVKNGARSITGSAGSVFLISGNKAITNSGGGTLSFGTNVTLRLTATLNFGSSLTTINGTLQLNSGYGVSNSPAYGATSLLQYNSGGVPGRSTEWNATSGFGYPNNVQISNNTTLDLGANGGTATARQCAGNLTIDNGSVLTMDNATNKMTAALTISGNISGSGTLTLSGSIGGDLYIKGNWTFTGTLNNNNRAVFFTGATTQTLSNSATFDYLFFNNSASSINISAITGANQQLEIQSGNIELNLTNAISSTTLIKLSGGTLKTNGYSQNTGAALLLNDNSTINLGSGIHSLNFAASNGQTWTGGKTLTITGWTGTGGTSGTNGKIYVGSNSSGLTSAQLQMISFNSYSGTPILLSTGELVPGCSLATEPTVNSSSISITDVGALTMKLSWTSGNGSNRIVVAKAGSAISGSPTDANSYAANSVFGTGSTIATNEYVVYNNIGNTVTITGLTQNTTYYFKIFEYNGTSCSINYLTSSPASVSQSTFNGYPCKTGGGLWSAPSTWVDGVPPSGADVIINENVTFDQNATVHNLTIYSGKVFTIQDYNLYINTGGVITNNGTFTATTGKVIFNGSGTVTGIVTFYNVDLNGGVNFGSNSTVTGTMKINSGGYVNTNAPAYADNSTLIYAVDYELASEWYANQSSGQGVPYNVIINGGNVYMNTTANLSRTLRGSLTISTGNTFSLSTTAGGDLIIKGNFTNNGTFNANLRSVGFYGTNAQTIITGASSTTNFDYVDINNSAGLTLSTLRNNNLNISKQLLLSTGNLSVGASNSITMGGAPGAGSEIRSNGGNLTAGSDAGTFICSSKCDIIGNLIFYNITLNNVGSAGLGNGCNFQNNQTITNTLQINANGFVDINAPTYATGSTLKYNNGGGYDRRVEWSALSGAGLPYNVWITNNSELRLGFEFTGVAKQCAGNLTIDNGSALYLDYYDMTQPLTVQGNLTNYGTITLSDLAGGDLYLKGNFTNNNLFYHKNRMVTFSGTSDQFISGTSATTFGYITLNKPSGEITLQANINVDIQIKFTQGILNTDDTHILTMNAGSSTFNAAADNCGASDISFVNGPMRKTGNTAFIFPVGDKAVTKYPLHPIGIELADASEVTFYAKYYNTPPSNRNMLENPVKRISSAEYWDLVRVSGTNNAYVTLRWRNMILPNPEDLVVVHYNSVSGKWESVGNTEITGISGANSYGTVRSGLCTSFSPFDYGTTEDEGWNPLPIELIDFSAKGENNSIKLNWTTVTESNNDYFTLEKSSDAINFNPFATIKGAGNSNKTLIYTYTDENPLNGINYYRLKQTDFDGKFEYSPVISYLYKIASDNLQFKFSNIIKTKNTLEISFTTPDNSTNMLYIIDNNGNTVKTAQINSHQGYNYYNLDISNLKPTMYLIVLKNYKNIISYKFIAN